MSIVSRIKSWFGRPRLSPPPGFPRVAARVSRDATYGSVLPNIIREWMQLPAEFPFRFYDALDNLAIQDPYVAKFVHTTVALGNPGHKLFIQAPTERRADEAIAVCNQLAARCFPFGGGMDGVVNAMLNQLARAGALCVEWVPDKRFTAIQQAVLVPIKTLRFRYADEAGTLELCQQQPGAVGTGGIGNLIPLNMVQTTYHALVLRDTNPYPVPPLLSALEACSHHRAIMHQIRTWMQKVSALGVLLADVEPPPREPGQSQSDYDNKARQYLESIADSLAHNLTEGLGVSYNNTKMTFQSVQAGAQGAKDLLQIILQGLFAALQRDPIWFGWNFNSTQSFASIVYEEMLRGLKTYQLGVKRAIEHGHRLNLALNAFGDCGLSMRFSEDARVDDFKAAQSEQMRAQAINIQYTSAGPEGPIINRKEARETLGYEDKRVEAGAYVATFDRATSRYAMSPFIPAFWALGEVSTGEEKHEENTQDASVQDGPQRPKVIHARPPDRHVAAN